MCPLSQNHHSIRLEGPKKTRDKLDIIGNQV